MTPVEPDDDLLALLAIADVLAGEEEVAPPLGAALVEAALQHRAPGPSLLATAAAERLPLPQVFARQAIDLTEALSGIGPHQWTSPTSYGRSVAELAAHVTATLQHFASLIGAGSFEVPAGCTSFLQHWELTEPTIIRLQAEGPDAIRADAAEIVDRLHTALTGLTDADWAYRIEGVISVRTYTEAKCFEMWMHGDDIRTATGRPQLDPDRDRMTAMADLATRTVPLGLALLGRSRPGRRARIVLTGVGGGTFVVPLGSDVDPARASDVVIVADTAEFCRCAGLLVSPADLTAEIEGDRALVDDVLAGARAFSA